MTDAQEFWINGESSRLYGIELSGSPVFSAAEPNYITQEIPGRNGVVHLWDGTFGAVTGRLPCFALKKQDVERAISAVNRWTYASGGNLEVIIDDDLGHYRIGVIKNSAECAQRMRTLAPFDIEMELRPERFIKNDDFVAIQTQAGKYITTSFFNSTPFVAAPQIIIKKTSDNPSKEFLLQIYTADETASKSDYTLSVDTDDFTSYVIIDLDTMTAEEGSNQVAVSCKKKNVLKPGSNIVAVMSSGLDVTMDSRLYDI